MRLLDVVPDERIAQELSTADLPVDMLNNAGITVDPTFVDAQTQTVASMRLGPSDHSRLQAVLHPASTEQALRQRLRTLVLTDPQRSFVSLEGAVAELSARGLTEATIELPFENTDALDYADLALGILNRRRGTNFTARLASGKAGELGLVTVGGVAARLAKAEATNSAGSLRAADLERRLLDSLPKVKELRFLTQLARESGVRVWVAGGSAAKLSFYTKWALEAERGVKPFQKERFDFEYANIFLPAAPLELIVDGPAAAVTSFKQRANERLAYAQPTIDTLPEFASKAHQVNDAASLAVELTEGATPRIVQIAPNARLSPSTFLDQVVDDHVRLRADAPLTPDGILLHLIDLSRNGLLPDDAEISALRTAVGQIDGAYPVSKGVVPKAERMLGEALDVEQTFALLDALGVRAKLLERGEGDRLAVSFDKQPLQTTDLEQTDPSKWVGPMAAFASHRTKSFDGYASMTSNPSGKPNFLVSRRSNHWGALGDKFGENAAYLPKDREFAFYAMRGDAGINGTEQSFDVRMMIDPRATAGDLDAMSQYNGGLRLYSNAAKIRFQNPTLDFARFFEGIADGSLRSALGDAALNILRRKLKSESLVLDEQATQRLLGWVEEQALHSQREGRTSPLVGEAILTNLAVREDTLNRWNSLGLMTREVKKVLGSLDSSRLPWLQSLLRD